MTQLTKDDTFQFWKNVKNVLKMPKFLEHTIRTTTKFQKGYPPLYDQNGQLILFPTNGLINNQGL